MNSSRKWRKFLSFVAYVVFAIFIAYLMTSRQETLLAIGTKAPIDTYYYQLNGNAISFQKLLKKPVVINFFATWCAPCLKEMPILARLAKKYARSVSFLGLCAQGNPKEIADLKQKFSLDYEIGVVDDATLDIWRARAIPTTYILDTTGKIIFVHLGIVTEDEIENALIMARHRN